jgi:hypothetical protein
MQNENPIESPALEVGGILYCYTHYYGLSKYQITRITKTIVYLKKIGSSCEYKASTSLTDYAGNVAIKGKGDNKDYYQLETPNLKARYEKEQKQGRIGEFFNRGKWREKLTDSDLEVICKIIDERLK